MNKPITIGVIGAGQFAFFAVGEFIKVVGVTLAAVYDENENNSLHFKELNSRIKITASIEDLLLDQSIELVYIATPPYLHYAQSKMALLAGKHVICEKPAAIKLVHAIELSSLAKERDLLFVVNLMQRYNPLYEKVTGLIQQNILGKFLHGFFENYASDEKLTAEHWFWDEIKSGGIFIEHAVHFFDMFAGWFGKGNVIAAQKIHRRSHKNIFDKAQSIVLYDDAIVNFYHGFDQPKILDRQEMRLLFEKGEITLYEWVPTQLKITALCTKDELKKLEFLFPGATITIAEQFDVPHISTGRFKEILYQYKIRLDTGDTVKKQTLYQELVTAMFTDQLTWINNRMHIRIIDHDNAVNSLQMAEESEQSAIRL